MRREARLAQAASDAVDELFAGSVGINRTDARCLEVLTLHGPMTAGELAERTALTTGAVTALLDRMERSGYVRRLRDQADRRRVNVELTDHARQMAEAFYAPLADRGDALLERFSTRELLVLLDATRGGREINEEFARAMRERIPRRGLLDSVRAIKAEAKAIKDEWAAEGRAIKRELKAELKAQAEDLRRRTTGR